MPIEPGVTCFIGENNAGKSNLFQAIRLVLDGSLSPQRRRLLAEDLAAGLSFSRPEHVLVSVELSGFEGNENEEALVFASKLATGQARISYRFRPKPAVRETIAQIAENDPIPSLKLDDYSWEMVGGGDDVELRNIAWNENFGTRFNTDTLQQGFLLVLMEALRDVEARLALSRTSPLQQIIEQCEIPNAEQLDLVSHLKVANENINASPTIQQLGTEITGSFRETAGKSFAMGVSLGLGEASFSDISRGLRVLLSGYGLETLDPSRNGLGLNNILFISMLLNSFERRINQHETAGQLLLVEEPEAHLHPQLQRVLLTTLHNKPVQTFITTHCTHITSGVPLSSHVVLICDGGPETLGVKISAIESLDDGARADLERYLDATRSTLLYARKVLLVEGPAEQFLIPPLVKEVMGVDLEEEGIAVVPIYGTHFGAYTKLFGRGGLTKRCAVLADGDLQPSDSQPAGGTDDEDGELMATATDLAALQNDWVKVFQSQTTFERELTLAGNLQMLQKGVADAGGTRLAEALATAVAAQSAGGEVDVTALSVRVLRAAKRVGKARFAQLLSKHTQGASELPPYITEGVSWLVNDAPNE